MNDNIPRFRGGSGYRRSEPTEDVGLTPEEICRREAEFLDRWQAASRRAAAHMDLLIKTLKRKPQP